MNVMHSDEQDDPRPIDAELMRLVAQRRAAIAGDPEWDRVLARFVTWAVESDPALDEDEEEEVELDPTLVLRTLSQDR